MIIPGTPIPPGRLTETPRCTARGCPVRWRSGPSRPCALHEDDDGPRITQPFADAAAYLGMTVEDAMAAPAEHKNGDGQ